MASVLRIYALFLVASIVVGYFTYSSIDLSSVDNLISILQNVSAMIFTIMGLWVAFIYPQALNAISDTDRLGDIHGIEKIKRIEGLVLVILSSAFVMLSLLAYNMLFMLFSNHDFVKTNASHFKLMAISFLIFLSMVQSKAVLSVMLANVRFVNDLHQRRNSINLEKDL